MGYESSVFQALAWPWSSSICSIIIACFFFTECLSATWSIIRLSNLHQDERLDTLVLMGFLHAVWSLFVIQQGSVHLLHYGLSLSFSKAHGLESRPANFDLTALPPWLLGARPCRIRCFNVATFVLLSPCCNCCTA